MLGQHNDRDVSLYGPKSSLDGATSAKAGVSLHAKHCIVLKNIAVSQAAVLCYRRLFSRKKAAQRAKRMAGQGLGTWGVTAPLVKGAPAGLRPPTHSRLSRRDSPTYDYHSRSALPFCSSASTYHCVNCCEPRLSTLSALDCGERVWHHTAVDSCSTQHTTHVVAGSGPGRGPLLGPVPAHLAGQSLFLTTMLLCTKISIMRLLMLLMMCILWFENCICIKNAVSLTN